MIKRFRNWLISLSTRRAPDLQIGGAENPYLNRWYLIPRNPVFNIYLHQFMRDDDDRAFHDHPWWSLSWCLRGHMAEWSMYGYRSIDTGRWTLRDPNFAHRLVVLKEWRGDVYTLFMTGPRLREWGFHCAKGWVHWRKFTAGKNGEVVGAGCGEMS